MFSVDLLSYALTMYGFVPIFIACLAQKHHAPRSAHISICARTSEIHEAYNVMVDLMKEEHYLQLHMLLSLEVRHLSSASYNGPPTA